MSKQTNINSLEFAEKSLEIHDIIAPLDLGRLADMLHGRDGELRYALKGSIDKQGKPQLELHLQGKLNLVCQRCLGAVEFALDSTTRFIIVASEEMLPAPEDEDDTVDYMVADQHLSVEALIEDEVLLSLPLAPAHEQCSPEASGTHEQKESPFKILQGLKLGRN
ncbi:MAG TPA: DUF177 domain-containing protein [Methylophilaceae bacterium]|nr:DUF177 domain-containing protein [Methylophilaceae bacterium]